MKSQNENPTGAECAAVAFDMPVDERNRRAFEAVFHGLGHNAGFCQQSGVVGEFIEFDIFVTAAAAHILAKSNPDLSAALCLESERMLHELAKEP